MCGCTDESGHSPVVAGCQLRNGVALERLAEGSCQVVSNRRGQTCRTFCLGIVEQGALTLRRGYKHRQASGQCGAPNTPSCMASARWQWSGRWHRRSWRPRRFLGSQQPNYGYCGIERWTAGVHRPKTPQKHTKLFTTDSNFEIDMASCCSTHVGPYW